VLRPSSINVFFVRIASSINVFDVALQRPTAKELLKHRFIQKAKKTTFLVEVVERFRAWRTKHPKSDDESDSDE
jgi:transposase-like protein